ncbi:MAG: UDP-3-O-acyl-N-acetylglucosamine deacetylase [Cyanobacteriota bacterium]|nr:UDP-3-O-acyl-N-acetylglucosamine deacetylase [Cyanobacteriota bacterium]
MHAQKYKLINKISRQGVGLHSATVTKVSLLPAQTDSGRYFVRVDLPNAPVIPAAVNSVVSTTLSTELGMGDARVRTGEHLLAALAAMGVDNARIEIDGPEVPLLDGSAKLWVEAIATVALASETRSLPSKIHSPIWIHQGQSFVAAIPSPETRFSYGIDFDLPAIGNQWHSWSPATESFRETIAPARTFCLAHQIEQLREIGLIKGGTLENALVCGPEGWLNPPLRFANEPVRHKILDLVGDLSLLGTIPQAHYLAYKASHNLHVQLAEKIKNSSNNQARVKDLSPIAQS